MVLGFFGYKQQLITENIMRNTLLKTGSIVVAEKEDQAATEWKVVERGTKAVTLIRIDDRGLTVGLPTAVKIQSDIDEIDGVEQLVELVEWVDGKKLGAELAYVK